MARKEKYDGCVSTKPFNRRNGKNTDFVIVNGHNRMFKMYMF